MELMCNDISDSENTKLTAADIFLSLGETQVSEVAGAIGFKEIVSTLKTQKSSFYITVNQLGKPDRFLKAYSSDWIISGWK